jgi:hypothetical protein
VTHTKNTICPWAREETSNFIHAEGVRFAVPSSARQARKVLSLRKDIRGPMKTAKRAQVLPRPVRPCLARWQRGGKTPFTGP